MVFGTLTDSGPGYFIVHHRKNGRDMEAYLACPKTAYSRINHKNGSKQRMERNSMNPTPTIDKEPKILRFSL